MTSLYELTIPFLIKALKTEQTLLAKAEAFEGASIDDLVNTTFATEPAKMWPLWKQIAISALHAQVTVGSFRKTTPKHYDIRAETTSLDDLKTYVAETIATLESVKPEEVNGKEGEVFQAMLGQDDQGKPLFKSMKAINFIEGYVKPNVFFHLTTLYDLLRWKGLSIGKGDYLGAFLVIEQ